MERIKEIRRVNFESLLRQHKARRGLLKDFATSHGMDVSHCSQIKIGNREIGDELARRIESKHVPKLPLGWLDKEQHEHDPQGAREEAYAKLAITLFRMNPRGAQRALDDLRKNGRNISAKK